MSTSTRRLLALAPMVAALTVAACSTPLSSGPATTTTAPPTTSTIPGSQTPAQTKAADYRAALTSLMVEHVYLLARVTGQAAAGPATAASSAVSAVAGAPATTAPPAGGAGTASSATATTAPATTVAPAPPLPASTSTGVEGDAETALDQNSHDLADALSQAKGYGSSFGTAFYSLWTARIADFRSLARADAGNDKAASSAATAALADNATALAGLIHATNKFVAVKTLGGTGMLDELTPVNESVVTFIGDQASRSPAVAADVVKAAELMYHTADYLAAAAAKLDGLQFPGTATGTAANLRASLTMVWVEHVELTSIDIGLVGTGANDAVWAAAVTDNSTQIQNALAVNIGDQGGDRFATAWGRYIGALRAYTRARATGDRAAASAASARLDAVPQAVGAALHDAAPELGADVVAGDVSPVVTGLVDAANAASGGAPDVVITRTAAAASTRLASDVAEAFAVAAPNLYSA